MNKASNLCIECGMCCDGTLFNTAIVEFADKPQVISVGLSVNEKHGELSFEQPCKYFCNNQCGIYMQRPSVCIGYRCILLKKLERDELTLEQALLKVKTARALQVRLEAVMPNAKAKPISANEVYNFGCSINENELIERQKNAMFLLLANNFIGLIRDAFMNNPNWVRPKSASSLESK